jgi:hypothetical protein
LGPFTGTDVWANASLGTLYSGYTALTVNAGGVVVLSLVPVTYTYYVDSVSGSDSNPGTLAQPWATVAKVNAATLSSGNSIGFKAGGNWNTETLLVAQNNITYSIYGSGADPIVGGYNTNSKTGYVFQGVNFVTPTVTPKDSYTPTASSSQVIRYNSGNQEDGMPFLATASYQLAQGLVSLKKSGSPTGSIWMELWTISGGLPVALVATSHTLDVSTLTSSFVDYTFQFDFMPQITSGSYYALIMNGNFTVSATNYANGGYNNSPGYASGTNAAYNGSSWSSNASRPWRFKTFGAT